MERRWALIPVLAVSLALSACAGSNGSPQGSAAQPTQVTAMSGAPSEAATDALASTAAAPADDCTKTAAAVDAYFSDGKARAAAEDLLALTTRMIKQADAKRTRAVYGSATEDLPELLDAIPAPLLTLAGVNPTGCDQTVQDRYVAARRDLSRALRNDVDGPGWASSMALSGWLKGYNPRTDVGANHAVSQFQLEGVVEYSLRPMKDRIQGYLAESEP